MPRKTLPDMKALGELLQEGTKSSGSASKHKHERNIDGGGERCPDPDRGAIARRQHQQRQRQAVRGLVHEKCQRDATD